MDIGGEALRGTSPEARVAELLGAASRRAAACIPPLGALCIALRADEAPSRRSGWWTARRLATPRRASRPPASCLMRWRRGCFGAGPRSSHSQRSRRPRARRCRAARRWTPAAAASAAPRRWSNGWRWQGQGSVTATPRRTLRRAGARQRTRRCERSILARSATSCDTRGHHGSGQKAAQAGHTSHVSPVQERCCAPMPARSVVETSRSRRRLRRRGASARRRRCVCAPRRATK
jgi:hypothetical protein